MSSKRVLRVTGDGDSKYIHKECNKERCISCSAKRMKGKTVGSKDIKEIDRMMSKYTINVPSKKHKKRPRYTSSSSDDELYSSEEPRLPTYSTRSPSRSVTRSPTRSVIRSTSRSTNGNVVRSPNGNVVRSPNGNVVRSSNGNVVRSPNGNVVRSSRAPNGNLPMSYREEEDSSDEDSMEINGDVYYSDSRSSSVSYEEPLDRRSKATSPLIRRPSSPTYRSNAISSMRNGGEVLYNSDGEEVL